MRIVVDCRYVRLDHHDGISRYTAGLVTELGRLHPLIMLISDHRQLALLPALPWQLTRAPTSLLEPLVALSVNRLKPDVVFSPMQTMGSWGRKYRLFLTVHDLIYYRNRTPPRDLSPFIRLLWRAYHLSWWPQRMLLNGADGIITVSQTTRSLIVKHHLTKRPITVVPNAAENVGGHPLSRTVPKTARLIYMGSFMPYKNLDTLVFAMAELSEYELHLLSRVSVKERTRLTRLAPQARLVFHNGVTDEEYHQLLGSATALVTASLDEGFGIPVIEAMRQGIPVVVSDIPIFREIGGEAALYFDAHNADAISDAVRCLAKPGEWFARSSQSIAQSGRFTWASSARTLLGVLAEEAPTRSD